MKQNFVRVDPCDVIVMQSDAGYSRCGLGSDGTDRLVALVRQEQALALQHQEALALFGAKITGGGSGGAIQNRTEGHSTLTHAIFHISCILRRVGLGWVGLWCGVVCYVVLHVC